MTINKDEAIKTLIGVQRYEEYGNESGGGLQEALDGDFIRLDEACAAHPVAGSPAEAVLFPVAWELHQEGFPVNESPEVRIVLSSRMADEYIEEGWELERTLLSDKRTKSYARNYDESLTTAEPVSTPTTPVVAEGLTDEQIVELALENFNGAYLNLWKYDPSGLHALGLFRFARAVQSHLKGE